MPLPARCPQDLATWPDQGLLLYQKLLNFKVIGLMLHKAKPVPLMFPPGQPPKLRPKSSLAQGLIGG